MAMYQAKDTFSAELKDGSSLLVTKGAAFHESHEVVKLDAGRGLLFQKMDAGAPDQAPSKTARIPKGSA